MRPIFHFKKKTIESHVLICAVALAAVKFVEIKTGVSTRNLVEMLTEVTDTVIYHPQTQEKFYWRSEVPDRTETWLKDLWKTH